MSQEQIHTNQNTLTGVGGKSVADKYIQQTDWFKDGRDKAVKTLDREYHENIDNAIIEAIMPDEKSMLKSEGVGQGKPPV